jgi:protein-arginine kinase
VDTLSQSLDSIWLNLFFPNVYKKRQTSNPKCCLLLKSEEKMAKHLLVEKHLTVRHLVDTLYKEVCHPNGIFTDHHLAKCLLTKWHCHSCINQTSSWSNVSRPNGFRPKSAEPKNNKKIRIFDFFPVHFKILFLSYTKERVGSKRLLAEKHLAKRHLAERHLAERHLAERHLAERHLA